MVTFKDVEVNLSKMCHSTWMKHPFYWYHSKKNLCNHCFLVHARWGMLFINSQKQYIYIYSNHSIPIRVNQKYVIITVYSNCHFLYKFDNNLNNKKTYSFFWKWSNRLLLVTPSTKPSDPTTSSTWEAMNSEGFNAALMSIVQCLAALLFENGLKRKLWQCFCWPNLGRTWPNCYWVRVCLFLFVVGFGWCWHKRSVGWMERNQQNLVTTCNVLVVLHVVCFLDSNEA